MCFAGKEAPNLTLRFLSARVASKFDHTQPLSQVVGARRAELLILAP